MQRTGRINDPSYRLIVTEHTASVATGKFVEKVGTYDPKSKVRQLSEERIKYWMSVGAKPSATVHNMLVSLGILNAKKINVLPSYKAPAPPEEAKAEVTTPVAEAPAADSTPSTGSEQASSPQAEESPVEQPAEEPKEEEAPAGSTSSPQAGEAEEKPAA